MFCKRCGKYNPDGMKNCKYCGGELGNVQTVKPFEELRTYYDANKTKVGVLLSLFLGIVGLLIGLFLYPVRTEERDTFFDGWLKTTCVCTIISAIVMVSEIIDLIQALSYYM